MLHSKCDGRAAALQVAVKQVKKEKKEKDEMDLLHNEIIIWEQLKHPNLVRLVDVRAPRCRRRVPHARLHMCQTNLL